MHTPSMNGFVLRQRGWRERGQERGRAGGRGGGGGVTYARLAGTALPCDRECGGSGGRSGSVGEGGGRGSRLRTRASPAAGAERGALGRGIEGITFTFALVADNAEVAFASEGTLPALAPILGLEMCPWNVPANMH